jgi:hypothetical protein
MIGQSETGSSSQNIIITLFSSRRCTLCCTFDESQHSLQICMSKTIFMNQTRMFFDFSSSNFNLQGHILSTLGDSPRHLPHTLQKFEQFFTPTEEYLSVACFIPPMSLKLLTNCCIPACRKVQALTVCIMVSSSDSLSLELT